MEDGSGRYQKGRKRMNGQHDSSSAPQLLRKFIDMFGPTGEYAVCRKDGTPLGLGDIMSIGDVFEKAQKLIEEPPWVKLF